MFNHSNGVLAPSAEIESPYTGADAKHSTILALAPNGAYKQKTDHAELPLSLNEIVDTAVKAKQAGAAMLHLHIRDENKQHSLEPNMYRRTIDAIEDRLGKSLIIQITSEAAGQFSCEQQIASIRAVNPECVSIALREIIPDSSKVSAAQDLFHWCAVELCRLQFILYSESDLLSYFKYRNRNIIPPDPHSVLFVLGRYALNQASTEANLSPFLKHLHRLEVPWMICAFGASEQSCLLHAASKGGHMRLGFENNLLNNTGKPARDNIEQLQNISVTAASTRIALATTEQARKILDIR